MHNDQIARFICFGVGAYIAFQVLMYLLPYITVFLAVVGAGYLYSEHQRAKQKNRR